MSDDFPKERALSMKIDNETVLISTQRTEKLERKDKEAREARFSISKISGPQAVFRKIKAIYATGYEIIRIKSENADLTLEQRGRIHEAVRSARAEEISEGFRAIFTCVKQPWFNEEWLGRELNKNCFKDLKTIIDKCGIDPCGEKGEYHTMVIDGPIFNETIQVSKFSKEKSNSRLFIKITDFSLMPKPRLRMRNKPDT